MEVNGRVLLRRPRLYHSCSAIEEEEEEDDDDDEVCTFNPLNAELNPICHFLALLGAHHILHVSRIRVNLLSHTAVVSLPRPVYSVTKSPPFKQRYIVTTVTKAHS